MYLGQNEDVIDVTLSIFITRIYNLILTVTVNHHQPHIRENNLKSLRLSYLNKKLVILKGTPNLLYKFLKNMTSLGIVKQYIEYCRTIKDPLVCSSVDLKSKMHRIALNMKLERALIETKMISGLCTYMGINIYT
jgi:hypothetical protein